MTITLHRQLARYPSLAKCLERVHIIIIIIYTHSTHILIFVPPYYTCTHKYTSTCAGVLGRCGKLRDIATNSVRIIIIIITIIIIIINYTVITRYCYYLYEVVFQISTPNADFDGDFEIFVRRVKNTHRLLIRLNNYFESTTGEMISALLVLKFCIFTY